MGALDDDAGGDGLEESVGALPFLVELGSDVAPAYISSCWPYTNGCFGTALEVAGGDDDVCTWDCEFDAWIGMAWPCTRFGVDKFCGKVCCCVTVNPNWCIWCACTG